MDGEELQLSNKVLEEWTLNLNWSHKKVKTKDLRSCFEIFNVLNVNTRSFSRLVLAYNMV